MNVNRLTATMAAVLLLAAAGRAFSERASDVDRAASWPEFHGPGRSNISPETGLLKQWPEGGPPRLWEFSQCGEGYSGISIAQGLIFTAGSFDDEEMLLALDLDGHLKWKAPNGRSWQGAAPGSRTTPTYDAGCVYQMSAAGRLAAYDADSGKPRWSMDLISAFDAKYATWAFAENVLVDGDQVLCMPGGTKGRVVSLDKHTGKLLWANTQIEFPAAYCSPVIVTHRGLRQMISMTQKSIVGVEVATGKLLWSFPFVPKSPQNATAPCYHDGYVFVAGGHHRGGSLLKIADDSHSAAEVWSHVDLDNCHGGVIYHDGNLYGCGCRLGGKNFFCIDYLTGALKQSDKTLSKVGVTCAEDRIYCLNHRGRVSLLALTPAGFDIVSHFDLPKKPDNSYLAHPVICGGRLYLRYDQHLYAYDIRAK